MSVDALIYVRTLVKSPTGEAITLAGKAILWHLAMGYNATNDACWYSVKRIAKENGIQVRRAQSILAELTRKGVIWPEPRNRENGSCTSNFWHFTAIDGEAPADVKLAMERLRLMGRHGGDIGKSRKRRKIPTVRCEYAETYEQGHPVNSSLIR